MSSFTDTIKILITADGTKAVSEIDRVGKTAQTNLDRANKSSRDWGATLTRSGAAMVGFAAVAGVGLYKAALAADDAAQAQLRLENTLKNQPQLAGASKAAFTDLASGIAKMTVVDDDAIVSAEALLGQFGLTQDQILKLTPLVVDLSRKMGVDLDAAAKAVGKAVGGSGGALKRFGVDVGDLAKGADNTDAVFRGLSRTVGGFAEGEAKTFSGQMQQAKRDLGEVAEAVGSGVIPAFQTLLGPLKSAAESFKEMDPATQSLVGKFAGFATLIAGSAGAMALIAGQALKARDAFVQLNQDGSRSLTTIGKFGAAAGAVAGLAAAWEAYRSATAPIARDIDRIGQALERFQADSKASGVLADAFGDDLEDLKHKIELALESDVRDSKLTQGFETVRDIFGEGSTEIRQAAEDLSAVDDALVSLSKAGAAESAAKAFTKLGLAAKAQGIPISELLRSLPQYRGLLEDVASGVTDVSGATEGQIAAYAKAAEVSGTFIAANSSLDDRLRDTADAHEDAADAADKQASGLIRAKGAWDAFTKALDKRSKIRSAAEAPLDVADAFAAIAEAQSRAAEAQKQYDDLAASGEASAEQLADAQREVASAQRDVKRTSIEAFGAIDQGAQVLIEGAAAASNYALGQENGRAKTQAFIGELLKQRDTLQGPLRQAIVNYIAKILGIPKSKATDITLPEIEKRTSEVEHHTEKINATPGSKSTTFSTPGLSDAINNVIGLRGNIDSLHDKTITVTLINKILDLHGTIDGRATGGPVKAGAAYVVGENGPELFVPKMSGSIVPNGQRAKVRGIGGGGDVINISFNGPVASKREAERWVVDALKSARRRGDRDVA